MMTKAKWIVIAFKPHHGGLIRFNYATKKEADTKAKQLRASGYTDVDVDKV